MLSSGPRRSVATRTTEIVVEFRLRNARVTDVEPAVAAIGLDLVNPAAAHDAADVLRQLIYLPAATVVVAVAGSRVVGAGVLSIRPSARLGSLLGSIDELGVLPSGRIGQYLGEAETDLEAARRGVARAILEELIRSARNKGCAHVEVSPAAARDDVDLWTSAGFRKGRARFERPIR